MRYRIRPDRFPLEAKEIKTKYKNPKKRKKGKGAVEPPETFYDLAKLVQAANKFQAKVPFVAYKIYNLGERDSGFRVKGEIQDFIKIRDLCLRDGVLWEDPEFLPNEKSLYYSKAPDTHIEWKRPREIVNDPQFFVDGFSRFDVEQGQLGDCWFLAAVANLTLYKKLFHQIVPDDQDFSDKYTGAFHFRFWQYGRWVDVVVDDQLPTYRDHLIYIHSTEKNEFWSVLLEKAYAKLHGSYEALKRGSIYEAMEDFTGGITETYELNIGAPNLFTILLHAYERSSLMGCALQPDPHTQEAATAEGLVQGHEYSITCVKLAEIETPASKGVIQLVRLRNPWGNNAEWTGPWSDQSSEWQYIPEHEKEEMGLTIAADGEFWMSYDDFHTHFQRLEICNLDPDSLSEEELEEGKKKTWDMSVFDGEWVRGVTAGGCRNYLDTFWHNPQYRITLIEPDEGDNEDKCTVIIALMQKNRRRLRKMGMECLSIGFAVYHLPNPEELPKPLGYNYFKYNACIVHSPTFTDIREVSCRFKLLPGTYCIVPSTFEPNVEGEFLLRVFSENRNKMVVYDNPVDYCAIDKRLRKSDMGCCNKPGSVKERVSARDEQREREKVQDIFLRLTGEEMEVDWMELKEILDFTMRREVPRGFSNDICRSMVAMMDADYSGKLGLEEFKILWTDLRNWKSVFKFYDLAGNNYISAFELRAALESAGYRVNNHILNILVHRYGTKEGHIIFDDFIMCAVRLKTMIDLFRDKDRDNTDQATVTLEEWLQKTVYS